MRGQFCIVLHQGCLANSKYYREQGYCVTKIFPKFLSSLIHYFANACYIMSVVILLKTTNTQGVCRSCSDLTFTFSLKFPTPNQQKPSLVSGVKGLKELRVKLILTTLDVAVVTFVRPTRKCWILHFVLVPELESWSYGVAIKTWQEHIKVTLDWVSV